MKNGKKHRTFDQVLPGYLEEKKIVLKPKTFIGHKGKLTLLGNWLTDNKLSSKPLHKIKSKHIHDFFIYLAETRDLDRATCEKYRDTLRVFFQYAKKNGEIKKIPFRDIVLPIKKRDNKPDYIPKDKQVELFEDIRKNDFQLFLASMIQYCSAVRPGNEMLNLRVGDFNFEAKTIRVGQLIAKTGKQDYADMTDELATYCIQYGIKGADPSLFIFGKRNTLGTKHICENNLPQRFNYFRDKHGISNRVKFYSCKHTGATDLINTKLVSLPQLQRHLRHDRITSTEKYILVHGGITNDVIKREFNSPLKVSKAS